MIGLRVVRSELTGGGRLVYNNPSEVGKEQREIISYRVL